MMGGLTHRDLGVLYRWVYEGGRCHTVGPGCFSTGGCMREGGGCHTVGPGCSLQVGV